MKKVILALTMIIGLSVSVSAQTIPKKEKQAETKMEMKDHVCTKACMNGNHMYAHGEKGHTCTSDCKKMEAKNDNMPMKEHQCTAACKDGKHMYAHGEKGHSCTQACKKTM